MFNACTKQGSTTSGAQSDLEFVLDASERTSYDVILNVKTHLDSVACNDDRKRQGLESINESCQNSDGCSLPFEKSAKDFVSCTRGNISNSKAVLTASAVNQVMHTIDNIKVYKRSKPYYCTSKKCNKELNGTTTNLKLNFDCHNSRNQSSDDLLYFENPSLKLISVKNDILGSDTESVGKVKEEKRIFINASENINGSTKFANIFNTVPSFNSSSTKQIEEKKDDKQTDVNNDLRLADIKKCLFTEPGLFKPEDAVTFLTREEIDALISLCRNSSQVNIVSGSENVCSASRDVNDDYSRNSKDTSESSVALPSSSGISNVNGSTNSMLNPQICDKIQPKTSKSKFGGWKLMSLKNIFSNKISKESNENIQEDNFEEKKQKENFVSGEKKDENANGSVDKCDKSCTADKKNSMKDAIIFHAEPEIYISLDKTTETPDATTMQHLITKAVSTTIAETVTNSSLNEKIEDHNSLKKLEYENIGDNMNTSYLSNMLLDIGKLSSNVKRVIEENSKDVVNRVENISASIRDGDVRGLQGQVVDLVHMGGPEVSGICASVKICLGIATIVAGHGLFGSAMIIWGTGAIGGAILWGSHREKVKDWIGNLTKPEESNSSSFLISAQNEKNFKGDASSTSTSSTSNNSSSNSSSSNSSSSNSSSSSNNSSSSNSSNCYSSSNSSNSSSSNSSSSNSYSSNSYSSSSSSNSSNSYSSSSYSSSSYSSSSNSSSSNSSSSNSSSSSSNSSSSSSSSNSSNSSNSSGNSSNSSSSSSSSSSNSIDISISRSTSSGNTEMFENNSSNTEILENNSSNTEILENDTDEISINIVPANDIFFDLPMINYDLSFYSVIDGEDYFSATNTAAAFSDRSRNSFEEEECINKTDEECINSFAEEECINNAEECINQESIHTEKKLQKKLGKGAVEVETKTGTEDTSCSHEQISWWQRIVFPKKKELSLFESNVTDSISS